ncbi:hypothetical protein L6505_07040 [Helicobacter pylori]|nr:hypothetical protein [Helicobacter pylori]UKJ09966.1 hypothetical protein L6505_07040 [Helicobacter pylori]
MGLTLEPLSQIRARLGKAEQGEGCSPTSGRDVKIACFFADEYGIKVKAGFGLARYKRYG